MDLPEERTSRGRGVAQPLRLALPVGDHYARRTREALERLNVGDVADRQLRFVTADEAISVYLLKLRDIPALVASGAIDCAVASEEWLAETEAVIHRVTRLGSDRSHLSVIGARRTLPITTGASCVGATQFPRVTTDALAGRMARFVVLPAHGSTEAYLPDLADFIVEYVSTGDTLRSNGLFELERLLDCDTHLIANPRGWPGIPGPLRTRLLKALGPFMA